MYICMHMCVQLGSNMLNIWKLRGRDRGRNTHNNPCLIFVLLKILCFVGL